VTTPRLALAVAVAFVAAALFFSALALVRRKRACVLLALAPAILLSPMLIPADGRLPRFLAAILAAVLLAKLYDLHADPAPGGRPGLVAFLASPFAVVLRRLGDERRPSRRENVAALALALAGLGAGVALFLGLFEVDWRRLPFAVEHGAKVLGFYLALLPAA